MPSTAPVPRALTVGEIARRHGVPIHRVQYLLRTRADIQPAARAGTTRVYGEADVDRIGEHLQAIEAARAGREM